MLCEPDFFTDFNSGKIHWDVSLQKGTLEPGSLDEDLSGLLNYIRDKGMTLNNLETRRVSLDDLFIELTGRHLNEE